MSMLAETVQLLAVLCQREQLTETEFTLKEAAASYVELQLRTATTMFEKELEEEELDGDSKLPAKTGN